MTQKAMYRVFDWNWDTGDYYFEKRSEAKKYYAKMIEEEPEASWRLYKDTEKPDGSGNFTEDCISAHNQSLGV